MLFPFAEDLSADSAPELAKLRAEAPLARIRLPDGQLAWLALRYADIKVVFSDPRFSREAATRPGAASVSPSTAVPGMLIGLDPPEHTRIRRLVSRAFSHRTIDQKRPRIQEIVDGLLDDLRDHGCPADLVSLFSYPLPLTVITEILGVPYADRGQFQQVVAVIMSASAHPAEEVHAAIGELAAYLARLIERKRAEPADDLLSALIAARDEGDKLSEQELLNNAHLILAAGHDTTAGNDGPDGPDIGTGHGGQPENGGTRDGGTLDHGPLAAVPVLEPCRVATAGQQQRTSGPDIGAGDGRQAEEVARHNCGGGDDAPRAVPMLTERLIIADGILG